MLGARQGDPEAPTSGTLYARQRLLQAELEALEEETLAAVGSSSRSGTKTARPARSGHRRAIEDILLDMRRVNEELTAIQVEMEEIDRLIAGAERKAR
jgi:hypothetical protein